MTNTKVLEEYFIWEEKNLIEPKMKSKNNGVTDQEDITKNTKTLNESENWRDITDPKLRKKMRLKEKSIKRKSYFKAYREANKDKRKDYARIYMKTYHSINKEKIYYYRNNKLKTDIQFKLSCILRNRLNTAIKENFKIGSAVRDLGCTIDELKIYLESKFQNGMCWSNYGKDGWHIDHIIPLASFDLTDRNQLLEACHYTNLQPLWAKDNLSKGDRIC